MTITDSDLVAQRQETVDARGPAAASGAAAVRTALAAPPVQGVVVEVTATELPLACPRLDEAVSCSHPRVYLDILSTGEAPCPYCGTRYLLRAGEHGPDHHFGSDGLHQHRPQWRFKNSVRRSERPQTTQPNPAGVTDASGRTTLERITAWLRGERS